MFDGAPIIDGWNDGAAFVIKGSPLPSERTNNGTIVGHLILTEPVATSPMYLVDSFILVYIFAGMYVILKVK